MIRPHRASTLVFAFALNVLAACALFALSLSACTPATPTAGAQKDSDETPKAPPANAPPESRPPQPRPSEPKPPEPKPRAYSAKLVERPKAGRAAEILDSKGDSVATLVPGDFAQLLKVPDIANNSEKMIAQRVAGTDIVAVSVEENTGRILLAVRGFIYAEVSTDLVFLLHQKDKSEAPSPSPSAAWTIEPVYFDGPSAEKSSDGARPHLDVARVSFLQGGSLVIETSDASGGSSKLVYKKDRTAQNCTWTRGESRRCPSGIAPQ